MNNQAITTKKNRLALYIGLGGGVALEWYDWSIYGLMATFFGAHFFPSNNNVTSTLDALAVFALGFVVRPISGAIFGPVADRIGHKKVLLWSIGAMALSSLAMGIMPSYSEIGTSAAILLTLARLVQGVSTGIENPAASAAQLEMGRPGRRGFFAGIITGSFNQIGTLLAAVVAFLASMVFGKTIMADWGWRVPFIIGGVSAIIVLLARLSLPETGASVSSNKKLESTAKVWSKIWDHRLGVLAIIFVTGGTMIANYLFLTGLPNLANTVFKENSTSVFGLTSAFYVIMVVAGPIAGYWADRFGTSKVYLILRILLVPAYFVVLLYSQPGLGRLAVVMLGGGLVVAFNQTLFLYINATLMPQEIRTTGIAIGYGIATAVFGGTASYLFIDAQQVGKMWLFLTYSAVVCALSVVIYVWARHRGAVSEEEHVVQPLEQGATI
ncbi:MFS transporter [Alicyclobacillus acidoterrestris]|uniref:MFS transporter n=1 Tax=Alicyclobacillus acidoterrestris (strain ATCC 49025 / DSM 3922 / CIP 106132 / NCIMB 13137 / GD3B) TaxID=1356854 RepID=T0CK75_ALIAG|nr:MFS transporter [Alicyclobacillus acidoterrestris]EPZ52910.1 hypothetical protein N007_02070 [Alicyclobacillus acidoterrestris ATCC 49025]UNO49122.1 MFS transporter [Alicyclobacillus acidoterrestris]